MGSHGARVREYGGGTVVGLAAGSAGDTDTVQAHWHLLAMSDLQSGAGDRSAAGHRSHLVVKGRQPVTA
jgi:hypothetical protein